MNVSHVDEEALIVVPGWLKWSKHTVERMLRWLGLEVGLELSVHIMCWHELMWLWHTLMRRRRRMLHGRLQWRQLARPINRF